MIRLSIKPAIPGKYSIDTVQTTTLINRRDQELKFYLSTYLQTHYCVSKETTIRHKESRSRSSLSKSSTVKHLATADCRSNIYYQNSIADVKMY